MLKQEQKELLENLLLNDIRVSERRRVHILLMYNRGMTTSQIAREVELSNSRVRYWKRNFLAKGMAVFPSLSKLMDESGDSGEASDGLAATEPQIQEVKGTLPESVQLEPASEISRPPEPMTVEALRQMYKSDHRHVEHVLDLSLHLFDILKPTHNLPETIIPILTASSLLQDIAIDEDGETDPAKSNRLILEQPLVGFSAEQQQTIATVVGLIHGKVKFDRERMSEFPAMDPKHAPSLIALIRIAKGLDSSQSQSTTIENLTETPQAQYIVVKGENAVQDAKAAQRAAKNWFDLFKINLRVITTEHAEEIALVPGLIPFPEPMKSPGLDPMDTVAEAARKVLRYQFAQMLVHEQGTKRGEDIEELHDMRVPVRRMRVAFEIFHAAFDPKVLKPYIKGLRRIGRTLGRVRDLDVFMEKANHYLDSLPEEKHSGLDPLFRVWQSQREKARLKMLAYLEGNNYRSFLHKFNMFVSTPGVGVRKGGRDYHAPHFIRHAAPIMINSRLGAVRAYDEILPTATIEQLHELRIEFKRLRYIVEFFREVLGEEAKVIINQIKDVQDHLGDLNDAEVACQILSEFLDQWETHQQSLPLSQRESPEPIVAYLAARHAERHQLMTTFGETWKLFERPEFRKKLALAVAEM